MCVDIVIMLVTMHVCMYEYMLRRYKSLIKTGKYETAKDFWVSVKADAISIAISNDETLLFKNLGLQESLPAVDPFLIYSNSKNREFLEGYQLITNAYEVAATTITYIHTLLHSLTILPFPYRWIVRTSPRWCGP